MLYAIRVTVGNSNVMSAIHNSHSDSNSLYVINIQQSKFVFADVSMVTADTSARGVDCATDNERAVRV